MTWSPVLRRPALALISAALALACTTLAVAPDPGAAATVRRPLPAPPTPPEQLARTTRATPAPPAPMLAKGPVVWAAPVAIDQHAINALACLSLSLCVAVDSDGAVDTSSDPLGGGRTWHETGVDAANPLTGIACPSTSLCVAVDGAGNAVTSGDPGGPDAAWTVSPVDTAIAEPSAFGGGPDLLRGISCPAASFCLAVDSIGNAVFSGDPTGGTGAWTLVHIDDNFDYGCTGGGLTCQAPLMGVACPTTSDCAAVDFTGNILQTSSPAGSTAWPSRWAGGSPPQSLWSVSCSGQSFCATVDGTAGDVIGFDPATATAAVPLQTRRLPVAGYGIWCSSGPLCLVSGETAGGAAELAGTTDPAGAAAAWTLTGYGDVSAVSCPTASVCVAADNEGRVATGVTVAGLRTILRRQALAHPPRLRTLTRRRGYAMRVTTPLLGRLQVTWRAPGPGGQTLASATARFPGAQTRRVRLRLTAAGRALVRSASRVTVIATAVFQTTTGTVATERRLTLRAR